VACLLGLIIVGVIFRDRQKEGEVCLGIKFLISQLNASQESGQKATFDPHCVGQV